MNTCLEANYMTNLVKKDKPPMTQEQVDLIRNTVAKGATMDELKLFLYHANKTGLDPLARQIHFVKRGNQGTIQTGIDGYRAIAERTKQLAGIDDAIYDTEKEPNPGKATVTVYRMVEGNRVPFTATARWSEYAPQGTQGFMWNKMPYLMLAKCAEALALRKAFPNDLSGIYTNEEMQQADGKKKIESLYDSTASLIKTLPQDKRGQVIDNAIKSGEFSEEEIANLNSLRLCDTSPTQNSTPTTEGELTYISLPTS